MPMLEMASGVAKSESASEAGAAGETGAPVPRDAIDPDLIKLQRPRTKVGLVTAAGIVLLCAYFLFRLAPDRHFANASSTPTAVAVSDILAGKVSADEYVVVQAEPLMSHALRAVKTRGDLGLRVAPVRGTSDRMWLALSGDGWSQPTTDNQYKGRLRKLAELPFADAARSFATDHPRPVFATAAATRAALAGAPLETVAGDTVAVGDGDRVAVDVVDPTHSIIIASFNERLPSTAAWLAAFTSAGLTAKPATANPDDAALGQARFDVAAPAADTIKKLETAGLWAARVESVTQHLTTTWGALRKSPPGSFVLDGATVPESQLDLVGVYTARAIPEDAYALLVGELPDDYWYVMPITVTLAIIGLLFLWALVRAVRRDLLPTRP
jgi:hypothetical protein